MPLTSFVLEKLNSNSILVAKNYAQFFQIFKCKVFVDKVIKMRIRMKQVRVIFINAIVQ